MSFILDALRKAERTNQSQRKPAIPSRPRVLMDEPPAPPTDWRKIILISLAGCALVATGLVLGSWGKSKPSSMMHDTTASSTPVTSTHIIAANGNKTQTMRDSDMQVTESSAATLRETGARSLDAEIRKASVQQPRLSSQGQTSPTKNLTTIAPGKAPKPGSVTIAPGRVEIEMLPDYQSALASAEVPLPSLHLDMHVYSSKPEKRFVFVNLDKYRQGDKIDAHTQVESIEPNGAIINYKGFRFMLHAD